jgi:Fe-S cluster assembly protein SufD
MADIATRTGFTAEALREISERDASTTLARQREGAFGQFEAMPMPSPETEEWRYTDLQRFDLASFRHFGPQPVAENLDHVHPDLLEAMGKVGDRSGLSIQHNSTVVTTHLDGAEVAKGVVFTSLDGAAGTHPDLMQDHLHELVPPDRTRFAAMHAAFRTGGVLVYVPKNVRVELPLQAVTYVDMDGLALFPHTVIVLDQGAELTFIDRYVSPDLGRALSNSVVELYPGAGSSLSYIALQDWGLGLTHLSVQRARVSRDAEFRSLAVAFGASLSRIEVETVLEGDGGSSEMLGVYFADGEQHFDFRSIQDHVGSQTSSDLLYKGALKGKSRAVYSGTVVIEKGAHKCDAYQTNRNILLSEQSKADSIPNLEILSNDPVRCGHAASVGPVDEDTLFYLQSRGIPLQEAERLIVTGFFQEVLDRVRVGEVKESLEKAIADELATED